MGLSCYINNIVTFLDIIVVSMPSWAWVVTFRFWWRILSSSVSMPSWAWVVTPFPLQVYNNLFTFQCPHGLELLRKERATLVTCLLVSMPSWAWVVTWSPDCAMIGAREFQCPHGLELLHGEVWSNSVFRIVSMPSWAWVVTVSITFAVMWYCCFNALMGLSCYVI